MNALTPGALDALQLSRGALMSERPDAALLALRGELDATVAAMGRANVVDDIDDEELTAVSTRLAGVVDAIAATPPARTNEGRALKAAAAMQELRMVFSENHGGWPGKAEQMAWDLLSDLAGEVYVPPALPEEVRANCEPPRPPTWNAAAMWMATNPDADLLALRPDFDRLHALMIDYNKDLIPDGEAECADFDALCKRIATSAPAATAAGRTFQAAAAMHDLTYRMNEGDETTCATWLMLKGIAGDAFQSVEVRP